MKTTNTNSVEFSEEDFNMLLNPEATKLSFKSNIKVNWAFFKVDFKLKIAKLVGLFTRMLQKIS